MSDEVIAALLGALVGAGVTLVITLLGRWWTSRDARAASRRKYAEIAERRFQSFITAQSAEELEALNHESFSVSGMSRYVPSRATSVHLWFVLQQGRLFQDAASKIGIEDRNEWGRRQIQLYGDAIDALGELNGWARGSLNRSAAWFWWQLRTTERYAWVRARQLAEDDAKRVAASRRAKAREARERLRVERTSHEVGV